MNKLNHVAFIMDGNGRWGIKKNQSRNFGHLHGVQTVQKIVRESINLKIPVITFYVFSTENWKRPKSEINYLFRLINLYFLKELKNIIKNNIRINIVGKKTNLPKIIINRLNEVTKKTKNNKKIIVNLAINYGSKSEIIYACKKVLKKKEIVSEKNIQKYLYINSPNPDILIRTGGKKRLSNFLLWQIAYTEIFFEKKLWPDFKKEDFKKVLAKFKSIKRNFGSI
jgi:undecaprenyl diphosphate synthase